MKRFLYLAIAVMSTSCATIPRASVDMSLHLEQQLYALKQANESIINSVFETKEQEITTYLDDVWLPKYLEDLFEMPYIKGIWNEMVASNDANERLRVTLWLNKNIQNHYEEVKESLLLPIRQERQLVLQTINGEYDTAIRMNNTILRNIASANSIQEAYRDIASKLVDTNKIDSIVANSLKVMDDKLAIVQKSLDIYQKNEQDINDILKKFK